MNYRLGLVVPIIGDRECISCSWDIKRVINGLLSTIPDESYEVYRATTRCNFAFTAIKSYCINSFLDAQKNNSLDKLTAPVLVLFVVPEDYYDESVFKELADMTRNKVQLLGQNKSWEPNGGTNSNLTIHFLRLPQMELQEYILTAFRKIDGCEYYTVIDLYNSGTLDLARLIDTIASDKDCYNYLSLSEQFKLNQFVLSSNKRNWLFEKLKRPDLSVSDILADMRFDAETIGWFAADTKILGTTRRHVNELKARNRLGIY